MKSLAGLKVLVVAEDRDACDLLVIALTTLYSATVEAAQTALHALEIVTQQQPHLVITDIAMPDQDGYWLFQQIRAQNSTIPIFACSAVPNDSEYHPCVSFDAWFLKPLDLDELVQKMTRIACTR